MDLAELLDSENTETAEIALVDPKADPAGALAQHRKLWPANQAVASDKLPEAPEGSDRVRMRRCAAELAEAGIKMGGRFAKDDVADPHLHIGGWISGDGSMGRDRMHVQILDGGIWGKQQVAQMAQAALHRWGFPVVVTMDLNLAGCEPGDKTAALWAEVGQKPGYLGSGVSAPSPERMLLFIAHLRDTRAGHYIGSWAADTYTPDQAVEWCKAGVSSPSNAHRWEAMGVDADRAAEWLAARVDYHNAAGWIKAGMDPADAKPWRVIGCDYEQAQEWLDAGYTPSRAETWIKMFDNRYRAIGADEIKDCLDAGITDADAVDLLAAGCSDKDLKTLVKWVENFKIEMPEALEWAKLGSDFCGSGKRGRWTKLGFSPADVKAWQSALGHRAISVDVVKAKIAAGFDPSLSADWTALHPSFSRSSLIAGWTDAGLTPADAEPWIKLSDQFCDYSVAKGWADAGLGPADAKPWVDAFSGFANHSLVSRWQKADSRLVSDPQLAAKLAGLTDPDRLAQILDLMG